MLRAKHYIILMPSMAKKFYRQSSAVLSGDDFLFWLYDKYFGDGGANQRLPAAHFHSIHKALSSMLKDPFLSKATAKTQRLIEERTPRMVSFASNPAEQNQWERFADVSVRDKESVEADLYRLTMDYVADITSNTLMGEAFPKNNPGLYNDVWTFDEGFGTLLWGIPGITRGISKAKAARERLSTAIMDWHRALVSTLSGQDPGPKWGDLSDVSEPMLARTKALMAANAEERAALTTQLGIHWSSLVNLNKVIFWMLLEIILNADLETKIKAEIAPFCKVVNTDQGENRRSGQLKMDTDALMKACPLLRATFYETMRLYTDGIPYRKVRQDLSLTEGVEDLAAFGKSRPQTYTVKAGNFLILPTGKMHMDRRVWPAPDKFDPGRFVVRDDDSPKKVRADLLHLNPFGGGASMCKGRLYADREVPFFVAAFLTVWEFRLEEGFRKPELVYWGSGTASPKTPVRVRISRRAW